MKYAVISSATGRPVVVSEHRSAWFANLAAAVLNQRGGRPPYGVASIDCSAQAMINTCLHRDWALNELEQRDGGGAVRVLFGLVARSDDGKDWLTVHQADTALCEEDAATLTRLFA